MSLFNLTPSSPSYLRSWPTLKSPLKLKVEFCNQPFSSVQNKTWIEKILEKQEFYFKTYWNLYPKTANRPQHRPLRLVFALKLKMFHFFKLNTQYPPMHNWIPKWPPPPPCSFKSCISPHFSPAEYDLVSNFRSLEIIMSNFDIMCRSKWHQWISAKSIQ